MKKFRGDCSKTTSQVCLFKPHCENIYASREGRRLQVEQRSVKLWILTLKILSIKRLLARSMHRCPRNDVVRPSLKAANALLCMNSRHLGHRETNKHASGGFLEGKWIFTPPATIPRPPALRNLTMKSYPPPPPHPTKLQNGLPLQKKKKSQVLLTPLQSACISLQSDA